MDVWRVAGGYAPFVLEPAESVVPDVARRVPFQGMRSGIRASGPLWNDGLDTP